MLAERVVTAERLFVRPAIKRNLIRVGVTVVLARILIPTQLFATPIAFHVPRVRWVRRDRLGRLFSYPCLARRLQFCNDVLDDDLPYDFEQDNSGLLHRPIA